MLLCGLNVWHVCFDNSLDAYVPELWAPETLALLEESMVIGQLVHRDYSPLVAQYGDVVNVQRPAQYTAKRKHTNDDVTVQDSSAENIPVKLNQHVHVSFLIRDPEEAMSLQRVREKHLTTAAQAMARHVDKCLLQQVYSFLTNAKGGLGTLSSTNVVSQILAVREKMNVNLCPESGRAMFWTPRSETLALSNEVFHSAEKIGDNGSALREASMGRKLGFNHYMCQNTPAVLSGNTVGAALVDNAAGYAAGTSVVHIDTAGSAAEVGAWVVFGDDPTPHLITAIGTLAVEDQDITISPPLQAAVADNDTCTIYLAGLVNNAAGYAAGWAKKIVVDGFTSNAVQVGQLVSFGATTHRYGVMEVELSGANTIGITLDRPLEAAIADNDPVGIGPAGDYNFALTRGGVAMVIRNLKMPEPGSGVKGSVTSYNNLGVRVVVSYDPYKQGHLVTLDFLMGVALLDLDQGAVLLA